MGIIDEIRPVKIAYDALLMLLDGDMFKVRVKCSYWHWRVHEIWIASCMPLEELYRGLAERGSLQ
jgi:hypothetical protein